MCTALASYTGGYGMKRRSIETLKSALEPGGGEWWVRRVGERAGGVRSFAQFFAAMGVILLFLGLCNAILFVLSLIQTQAFEGPTWSVFYLSTTSIMGGAFQLLLALIFYERSEFYLVIQRLERRLVQRGTDDEGSANTL
jgi:hypothetical protein